MNTTLLIVALLIIAVGVFLITRSKPIGLYQVNLFSLFNRSLMEKIQANARQLNLFSFGNTQNIGKTDSADFLNVNISLRLEENTKQKIQHLIVKDKIDQAFAVLETSIPSNHPNHKDILQLHRRWTNIKKQDKLQYITPAIAKTETTRLVSTLLSIVES